MEITIILVEPEISGNLGACARIMKNFGVKKLVLINPKAQINQEARNRAKWAQEILENAQLQTNLENELKNYDAVIGTSGKLGNDYNITRSPIPVREISNHEEIDGNIAIVLGRESIGLTNQEIQMCEFLITIPTNKEYPVLNLSHALGIILYEFSNIQNKENLTKEHKKASIAEKHQIHKLLDGILETLEFTTEEKKETQRKVWKKIIGKAMLTKREANAVLGFLKKIKE